MNTFSQILPSHHRHCDELFVAAEESARSGDWPGAKFRLGRFIQQMQAHFEAEENVLFPAFETTTGVTQGPTRVMCLEHEQMRSLLAQLRTACENQHIENYEGAAETLLLLMQQHNMKEENILYPMCDQALVAEAAAIASRIQALLAEEHD